MSTLTVNSKSRSANLTGFGSGIELEPHVLKWIEKFIKYGGAHHLLQLLVESDLCKPLKEAAVHDGEQYLWKLQFRNSIIQIQIQIVRVAAVLRAITGCDVLMYSKYLSAITSPIVLVRRCQCNYLRYFIGVNACEI